MKRGKARPNPAETYKWILGSVVPNQRCLCANYDQQLLQNWSTNAE